MPIRSDHGRNAALRELLTWPLHSPRRLLTTTSVLTAVSIAITIGINAASNPHPTTQHPTTATTPSTTSRSVTAAPTSTTPPVPGNPQEAGRQFAEAWVAKIDTDTWRTRLSPLCTIEYAAAILPTTGPDRVSAMAVTTPPILVSAVGRSAAITVALDTITLALRLQDVTGTGDWRVADVQPAK
jgi:hypothetical protein